MIFWIFAHALYISYSLAVDIGNYTCNTVIAFGFASIPGTMLDLHHSHSLVVPSSQQLSFYPRTVADVSVPLTVEC